VFPTPRFRVWYYRLLIMWGSLFHPHSFSVRDTNFVHWLSIFCYPERSTATLLDQMDHPFGYTFRPANKTTYNSLLQRKFPTVCAEDQIHHEKRDVSSSYLYIYIRMWEANLKVGWHSNRCYWDFIWNFAGDLAKLRMLHKIMSWPFSSQQLTAHGSSHTSDSFDDGHLKNLTGIAFLNNRTRSNRKSFFPYISKTVKFYNHNSKESHVSTQTIRKVLTFASDMNLTPSQLIRPTLPATGDGGSR
jgi:hypothetical protein